MYWQKLFWYSVSNSIHCPNKLSRPCSTTIISWQQWVEAIHLGDAPATARLIRPNECTHSGGVPEAPGTGTGNWEPGTGYTHVFNKYAQWIYNCHVQASRICMHTIVIHWFTSFEITCDANNPTHTIRTVQLRIANVTHITTFNTPILIVRATGVWSNHEHL
jgi:hypothetical protein